LNVLDEILPALGSIEGELIEISKRNQRVSRWKSSNPGSKGPGQR